MKKIDYTTTPSDEPIITMTNEITAYVLASGLLEIPEKTSEMVFQNSTGGSAYYWLGSRCSNVGPDGADFGVCYVNEGGVVGDLLVGSYYGEFGRGDGVGVRPLVSLQSNIQLTSAGANTWDISAS